MSSQRYTFGHFLLFLRSSATLRCYIDILVYSITNILGGNEIASITEKSVLVGSSYFKVAFCQGQNLPKILIIALHTDLRVPCNSKIPPFSVQHFFKHGLYKNTLNASGNIFLGRNLISQTYRLPYQSIPAVHSSLLNPGYSKTKKLEFS